MTRGIALLAVVGLLGIALARHNWRRISEITEDDIRWVQGVGTNDRSVFGLIHRYLHRIRLHRFVGTAVGIVYAFVIGLMRFDRVTVGFQATSPWGDVLFCGVLGLLTGSLLAETYRVVPTLVRGSDPTDVPAPRLDAHLQDPASWLLVVLTVAIAMVERSGLSIVLALIAVASMIIYGVFLWVIRSGRRGLMPLDIRHADDAIRTFAAERCAVEALAAAVLLFGWQLALGPLATAGVWRGLTLVTLSIVALFLVVSTRPYPR